MDARACMLKTAVALAVFALQNNLLSTEARSQVNQGLAGNWTPVTIVTLQGGAEVEPFGANPKGVLNFDETGRYTLIIVRSDVPKFASNNRTTGTPKEYQAVVDGSIAHYGSYTVDGDTLVFRIVVPRFRTGMEPNRGGNSRLQAMS